MFPRTLDVPRSAFFLFGPRGTGKSTWARERLRDAFTINLLPPETALRYDPASLATRCAVTSRF